MLNKDKLLLAKKLGIVNFISQDDLLIKTTSEVIGLCKGLDIEYARHYLLNLQRGKNFDFTAKFINKVNNPTDNFLDRIDNYQVNYNNLGHNFTKLFNTHNEFIGLLDTSLFKSSNTILLSLYIHSTQSGHAILIKVEKTLDGNSNYIIYDPNFGETRPFTSKDELADAIENFKSVYAQHFKSFIEMGISNFDLEISNVGILNKNLEYSKDFKYIYKLINALKNKNFEEVYKLNKIHKIDYNSLGHVGAEDIKIIVRNGKFVVEPNCCHFSKVLDIKPNNIFEFALRQLDETQMIKLINENPYFDSLKFYNDEKSLHNLIIKLLTTDKLTSPIIESIVNKPAITSTALTNSNTHNLKVLMDISKIISTNPEGFQYCVKDNLLSIKIATNDPILVGFFKEIVFDINNHVVLSTEQLNINNAKIEIEPVHMRPSHFSTFNFDDEHSIIEITHNINKFVEYINHVDYLHSPHYHINQDAFPEFN